MKSGQILFSAPMVRALLDVTKTQTRRLAEVTDEGCSPGFVRPLAGMSPRRPKDHVSYCPYGSPGDLLWVREGFRLVAEADATPPRDTGPAYRIWYEADAPHQPGAGKLRPAIHMPRWASRITLRITDVRVERLQDISEADARAEGCRGNAAGSWGCEGLIEDFADLWDSLNAARGYGWDKNPWVWALTFDVLRANVDTVRVAP